MKLFKSTDEKFAEIGFVKVEEDKYGVTYERYVGSFIQKLAMIHKSNGKHIVQSYDPTLFDNKLIGNTSVGLSMYEIKLCFKKMKEMGWKIVK